MKKVLAISGSLRAESVNLKIIEAVTELASDQLKVSIYPHLSRIPAFNPDMDAEGAPPPVEIEAFRRLVRESDGVLICTPEYVFGVPGWLKNAIDWTVSSSAFSGKPTALITAAGLGERAHESLLLTLRTLEAKVPESSALLISHARTKINAAGEISDQATLEAVKRLIDSFGASIEETSSGASIEETSRD